MRLRRLITLFLMLAAFQPGPRAFDAVGEYRTQLKDYRRYAETLWHDAPGEPRMGYWGTGRGDWNNEGIRAVSNTALAYAYLYRSGDRAFSVAQRVEPALRWCADTHVTGPAACTDGKHWGNGWQTAMWAGTVGVAAFLVRDRLNPETLAAVKRCLAAEADRFNGVAPPDMQPGDTKSEENAWNLTAASAALLLMPEHPHAPLWKDTVLRWGFNTIPRESDRQSTVILDGKPVRDWVTTTQTFPDFTLENHGIFHPVYAMVGPATNAQAAVAFRLAGQPVPEALKYNVLNGWGMLQYITLADGEWLYPQGLDWDLHDYEHIHYFAMLATLYKRPESTVLERWLAAASRKRQKLNGDGRFVGESGNLGFAREAVQAERITFAALMHEQFGSPAKADPADWDRVAAGLEPVKAFGRAGFVVHRTQRGVTSFSWNHQLMGLVAPSSEKHQSRPYVTTPWQGSLTGRFTLEGQDARTANSVRVMAHDVQTGAFGYTVTVEAETNGGALRQALATSSVAPGIVAYVDRVTALRDVVVTEERGLPIAVENDAVSGGRRTLLTGGSTYTIGGGADRDVRVEGNWANIDRRLGLVSNSGTILYRAAGAPNRPGAREDYLFGAYSGTRRPFSAGQVVSERAGVILLNASVAETKALAASVKLERSGGDITMRYAAPNGSAHTLTLKGRTP